MHAICRNVLLSESAAIEVFQHQAMIQTSLFNFSKMLKDWISCRRSTSSCDRAALCLRGPSGFSNSALKSKNTYIRVKVWKWNNMFRNIFQSSAADFQLQLAFFRGDPGEPRDGGPSRTVFSEARGTRTVTFWRWRDVQIEKIKRPGWITEACGLLNVHSSCRTRRAKGKFGAKQVKFSLLFWCGTKPHDSRTPYFCLLSLDSRLATNYSIWGSWKKLNE